MRDKRQDTRVAKRRTSRARHTAASLAISAGAHVKAVQRTLGHASAVMTLDTYADLFEDDLDSVSEALGTAAASSNVAAILSAATPRDNDA
jgi:integrase